MESYESLVASGLTPIKPTPIINGRVPPPSTPSMGRALVGTIPPEMQLDADFAEQQYGGQIPSYRLMPPASSGKAAVNAAAQSTQVVVQQSSVGSGLLLETLGSKNPNQSVLNLQGTAVVGVDAAGNVTIDGGGDGLIHGDAISEIDPAYVVLRDDFINVNVGGAFTSFISEFPWYASNGGSTSSVFVGGGAIPSFGLVGISNSATAGSCSFLLPMLQAQPAQIGWPLLDYPGWKLIWTFNLDLMAAGSGAGPFTWAKVSTYVGLANYAGLSSSPTGGSTTPRPPFFLGLRYDTDPTAPAISDTQFMFEYVTNTTATPDTRENTQGTVVATGIAATKGTQYRLEISCIVAGQVNLFLTNGTTSFNTTMTVAQFTSSAAPTISATGGVAFYNSTTYFPWAAGSKVTIVGGANTDYNGTFVLLPANLQTLNAAFYSSSAQTGADTGAVTSVYPALVPFVSFGNDTTATPTANTKAIQIDFFGFVWNPGVGGGTGTPNPTKARYF